MGTFWTRRTGGNGTHTGKERTVATRMCVLCIFVPPVGPCPECSPSSPTATPLGDTQALQGDVFLEYHRKYQGRQWCELP